MATQTGLVCPKCRGRMLEFERTGILVDQCQECRGIFLDIGELERLIEAEGGGWSGRVGPPSELPDELDPDGRGHGKERDRARVVRDLFGE